MISSTPSMLLPPQTHSSEGSARAAGQAQRTPDQPAGPAQPPLPLGEAGALPEADAHSAGPAAGAPGAPGAPGVTLPPHLGSLEEKTHSEVESALRAPWGSPEGHCLKTFPYLTSGARGSLSLSKRQAPQTLLHRISQLSRRGLRALQMRPCLQYPAPARPIATGGGYQRAGGREPPARSPPAVSPRKESTLGVSHGRHRHVFFSVITQTMSCWWGAGRS